jgi:hypothetical protein
MKVEQQDINFWAFNYSYQTKKSHLFKFYSNSVYLIANCTKFKEDLTHKEFNQIYREQNIYIDDFIHCRLGFNTFSPDSYMIMKKHQAEAIDYDYKVFTEVFGMTHKKREIDEFRDEF